MKRIAPYYHESHYSGQGQECLELANQKATSSQSAPLRETWDDARYF